MMWPEPQKTIVLINMSTAAMNSLNSDLVCFSLCPPAPSIVPIMHQISSTMNSFTLSWPQPEQPNGIILDYELRYYEKVRHLCVSECWRCHLGL